MGFITGLYIRGCLTIYQLVIWISQPSIDIHRMCSHIFPWFWWFSKVFPICSYDFLFGGLEHVLFFRILGIVTPTDYIYFFSEGLKPPTSFPSSYGISHCYVWGPRSSGCLATITTARLLRLWNPCLRGRKPHAPVVELQLGFKMVIPYRMAPPSYPLVNIQKAIENGHRNSWFTH